MDTSRILAWSWRKNCWNCSLESWGIRLTSAKTSKTWPASSARFLFLKPPKVWEAGPLVPTCYNKLPLRKNRDFLSAKSYWTTLKATGSSQNSAGLKKRAKMRHVFFGLRPGLQSVDLVPLMWSDRPGDSDEKRPFSGRWRPISRWKMSRST